MHLHIDTLSYTNNLRQLPPEQKLLLAVAGLILALFSHPPTQIAIALWMLVWVVVYAGISAGIYLRLLLLAVLFALMSLPALILNITSTNQVVLVQADSLVGLAVGKGYVYLSHRGTLEALSILVRSIASTSCLFFILLTIPFADILQILSRWGFPKLLTEILMLMYRFIFILLNTAYSLWMAQETRCGHGDWRITIKSTSLLISQLFQRTIHQYHQLSLGLATRGFTGELTVGNLRYYRVNRRYAIEAVMGLALLVGLELWTNATI